MYNVRNQNCKGVWVLSFMPSKLIGYFMTVYKNINKSVVKFQVQFFGWKKTKLRATR